MQIVSQITKTEDGRYYYKDREYESFLQARAAMSWDMKQRRDERARKRGRHLAESPDLSYLMILKEGFKEALPALQQVWTLYAEKHPEQAEQAYLLRDQYLPDLEKVLESGDDCRNWGDLYKCAYVVDHGCTKEKTEICRVLQLGRDIEIAMKLIEAR